MVFHHILSPVATYIISNADTFPCHEKRLSRFVVFVFLNLSSHKNVQLLQHIPVFFFKFISVLSFQEHFNNLKFSL